MLPLAPPGGKHLRSVLPLISIAQIQCRRLASLAAELPQENKSFVLEDMDCVRKGDQEGIRGLPPFVVSRSRGFLPREDPLAELPREFDGLSSLLDRMTIRQPASDADKDGERKPGLLALGQFGDAVESELRVDGREMKAVQKLLSNPTTANNKHLIAALFRDYCFATSAYLLEPTDRSFRKTGSYVPGRSVLPAQLAVPITMLAENLGHFPFMEYASSYALQNWRVKSPSFDGPAGRLSFDNLSLIRAFEDAQGSERGFILVHVEMVAHSHILIAAAEDALEAVRDQDSSAFEHAFERLLDGYRKINRAMDLMWGRSKTSDYLKFRSFIFGTAPKRSNPMFPNGVVYRGVSDEAQYWRGESGANDNICPLGDNLLEIVKKFPPNELTATLREFRGYRPPNQRDYINQLEHRAAEAGVRAFALEKSGSAKAKALYILIVDQIREFRQRHWSFTKEYIVKHTKFPLATGGSPILSYLPHNLDVVLGVQEESFALFSAKDHAELAMLHGESGERLAQSVAQAGERAKAQRSILTREVADLQKNKSSGDGMATTKDASATQKPHYDSSAVDKVIRDEKKILQRGWVGSDGVG